MEEVRLKLLVVELQALILAYLWEIFVEAAPGRAKHRVVAEGLSQAAEAAQPKVICHTTRILHAQQIMIHHDHHDIYSISQDPHL